MRASVSNGVEGQLLGALARIKEADAKLNAVAHDIEAIAVTEAKRCDALALTGSNAGPLHGLLFAIKDIIDLAGIPTRSGSLTRSLQPASGSDATVVAKLRAAGAVPVVKSNTVEFAFGGWGTNVTVGTPVNPWLCHNPHVPGGSSSGTGVLVGAGLLPAGLGTDTGGSVRIPAAFCGCVGLKTSVGLVSRHGVTPLSETLDTVGPLSCDVETAARMLNVMQGPDFADPTTHNQPWVDALSGLHLGIDRLRLGVLPYDAMPDLADDVRASFEIALHWLRDAGATLAPCALPEPLAKYQALGGKISASEAYATYQDIADDANSGLGAPNRERMKVGRELTAAQLVRIRRQRDIDIANFDTVLDGFDAMVLPTTPTTAIPIAGVDESNMSMSSHTRFSNYLALGALSVPIDLTEAGLPTSLQIVVRRYQDPLALRIGAAFEKARGDWGFPALAD